MEKRPDFSEIHSFQEFSQYYWYREELQQICKSLGIDASGMKAELNHNIEEYFKGKLVQKKTPTRRSTRKTKTDGLVLTLETGLVECGFCFSQRFREFFSEQTGVKNFKFNVDMVATAKKVKEENDLSFTLGDMLAIYNGTKVYATYDNSSLQWNRFVKDFCADELSNAFTSKLKVASILWNEVRNSTREKTYDRNLLQEFADKIAAYRK